MAGHVPRLLAVLLSLQPASLSAQALRVTVPAAAPDVGGVGSVAMSAPTSADGRYVVFSSHESSFVSGDTNGAADVFLRDMVLGTTRRVSVGPGGTEANSSSYAPVISADGARVAFVSIATNLVAGQASCVQPNEPFCADVYVADVASGGVRVVSRIPGGTVPNGTSLSVALSADGRVVAFESAATNLVPADTNGRADLFVVDLVSEQLTRVTVNSAGVQATFEQISSPFPCLPVAQRRWTIRGLLLRRHQSGAQ